MNWRGYAVAVTVALLATSVGAREGGEPSIAQIATARQALAARLQGAEIGAVPPLLSNPADAALIRAAFDPRGLAQVTVATLGEGLDSCDLGNRYSVMLGFAGSRKDEFKGTAPDVAAKALVARQLVNAGKYQDELALSLRFTAFCMARLVEPMAAFWQGLPEGQRTQVRLDGLREARKGMTGIYLGLVMTQVDSGERPANRALLMEALLSNNDRLAQALTPADRKRVLDAIVRYLPAATGATRTDLIRLRDELAALPCLQLCAL
ncbi:MAG: hypothetical protein Q8L66_03450 [Caulobacter sp.]|nr:hypothetical protein [Caulobacter sp.]